MGWPVVDVGLVLAPRGVGTMIAMLACGRIGDRIDPRLLIAVGLATTAASLHHMAGFDTNVGTSTLVWTGIVQGLGIGFVFPPLTAVAFASLPPALRNDGTGLFSLVRNLGSSIGISLVVSALSRNTQANQAGLSVFTDPSNLPMRLAIEAGTVRIDTPEGLAMLQGEVVRQAATIAFLQDFRMMAWICVAALPLVVLLRRPSRVQGGPAHSPALD
jgi:DHA2 family multidrug resistance protein